MRMFVRREILVASSLFCTCLPLSLYVSAQELRCMGNVNYYNSVAQAQQACNAGYASSPSTSSKAYSGCKSINVNGMSGFQYSTWNDWNGQRTWGWFLNYNDPVSNWMCLNPAYQDKNWSVQYHFGAVRRCPDPLVFEPTQNQCVSLCPAGKTCDDNGVYPLQEELSCAGTGRHPIDYMKGRKYRHEFVISSGGSRAIVLKYLYNSLLGNEKTAGSMVPNDRGQNTLMMTPVSDPIPGSIYATNYYPNGLPIDGTVEPNQFYGSITQYWRHNFDEVIQKRAGVYYYHNPKGERIEFSTLGLNATYPSLSLQALVSGEESYAGYKLLNTNNQVIKKFDATGRLRKIERGPDDVLTLTYDTQDRLEAVTNSVDASLVFSYQSLPTNSIYSISNTTHDYPTEVLASDGTSVQLEWNVAYAGKTANFYLLTRLTEAVIGAPTAARDFEYADSRWPTSITDIYHVGDIATNTRELYAHFEYDDFGRAVYSGLANGAEAETVNYVNINTSVVTNALGKEATFLFADINGVTRLTKITGEPTTSCLQSEMEYVYDGNGNIYEELHNGRTTRYTYDSQNREIARTEAVGTDEARVISTEWHPTLNLRTKINEAGKETIFAYDSAGHLLSQTTNSVPIN